MTTIKEHMEDLTSYFFHKELLSQITDTVRQLKEKNSSLSIQDAFIELDQQRVVETIINLEDKIKRDILIIKKQNDWK